MTLFKRRQLSPVHSPSQLSGMTIIHGMAKGNSRMPDSPESAGFLDAAKMIQVSIVPDRIRNSDIADMPLFGHFR